MITQITATKYGIENIIFKFVKIKGVQVLKMIRPNGSELKTEDLR